MDIGGYSTSGVPRYVWFGEKGYGLRLGNPKAAAHVAVRPSVLVTVKG